MVGEERKIISIGMEDFKEIINKNGYFVDKTQMIQQLLDSNSKVTLFTRPRRFGKTLNLSMIRRFFEDERLADGTTACISVDAGRSTCSISSSIRSSACH